MIDELIQKQVEEFRKEFAYHNDGIYFIDDPTSQADLEDIEAHLVRSMKKVGEEIESRYKSKLGMIALGILTFKESEKERYEEEKISLIRRDGGPTMMAFSFINKLLDEINLIIEDSLTDKGE